ncbi:MAG: carbohydrate ABC transporter permease [Spirochaetales bacterium]
MVVKSKIAQIPIYVILLIYAVIVVLPVFWMFNTAFKSPPELMVNKFGLPSIWRFENFAKAWEMAQIGRGFLNTIIVVLIVFIFGIGTASAVSFALSRFRFRMQNATYLLFIAGLMVPMHAVIIPIYDTAIRLNVLNNLFYLGLVYSGFLIPLCVLILTSFMSQIPIEIDESALMDGCSSWMIYTRLILPMSREGLISVMILTGLETWNDLFLPLVLLNRKEVHTISVGMRAFFAEHEIQPTLLIAGSFLAMLPVLILYAALQEKVIKGLTMGAVKG